MENSILKTNMVINKALLDLKVSEARKVAYHTGIFQALWGFNGEHHVCWEHPEENYNNLLERVKEVKWFIDSTVTTLTWALDKKEVRAWLDTFGCVGKAYAYSSGLYAGDEWYFPNMREFLDILYGMPLKESEEKL